MICFLCCSAAGAREALPSRCPTRKRPQKLAKADCGHSQAALARGDPWHKMMRAVLALLCLLEGATCRVTRREGQVPPSKTIKKVDCGSWNHPDSEENTRKTVYGKIGWACMAEYGEKGEIGEDQTLIDVGIGTGFDDDRPVRDDVYETRYADPYV